MTDLNDEPEFTPSYSEPGDPFGEWSRNWGHRRIRQAEPNDTGDTDDEDPPETDPAHRPRGPDRDDEGR